MTLLEFIGLVLSPDNPFRLFWALLFIIVGLLTLFLLLFFGAWVGMRLSGRFLRCVVGLHHWIPMTTRTLAALGISRDEKKAPHWRLVQCADCSRPSVQRLSFAKRRGYQSVDDDAGAEV